MSIQEVPNHREKIVGISTSTSKENIRGRKKEKYSGGSCGSVRAWLVAARAVGLGEKLEMCNSEWLPGPAWLLAEPRAGSKFPMVYY